MRIKQSSNTNISQLVAFISPHKDTLRIDYFRGLEGRPFLTSNMQLEFPQDKKFSNFHDKSHCS